MNAIEKGSELYSRITDTIFSVLVSFSFVEYSTFIVRPDLSSTRFWMLLFAYSIVTMSRVGYHKSVATKPYKNAGRFIIDLWILYGYFVLLNAPGPTQFSSLLGIPPSPDVGLMVLGVFYVLVGYVIWDLVKKYEWPDSSVPRIMTTVFCWLFSFVALGEYYGANPLGQLPNLEVTWLFIGLSSVPMLTFWYLKLLRPSVEGLAAWIKRRVASSRLFRR